MVYEIRRVKVQRYRFYATRKLFVFNSSYRNARKWADSPMDTCFVCGDKFREGDEIHLLFSRDITGNKVACRKCALMVQSELTKDKEDRHDQREPVSAPNC